MTAGSRQELSGREGHVVPIRRYLAGAVFDPEIVSVMGAAFEDVRDALEVSGRSDVTEEMIAERIIQLARRGETDPTVLGANVLSELGLSRKEP
jgi:hypothetical protein